MTEKKPSAAESSTFAERRAQREAEEAVGLRPVAQQRRYLATSVNSDPTVVRTNG